jgi:ribosome biogenesis GTPase
VDIYALGWSSAWDYVLERVPVDSLVRIIARHKGSYRGMRVSGAEINCYSSGRSLHRVTLQSEFPAVGDWCVIGENFVDETNSMAAVIKEILPRRSKLSRMVAGDETDEQILAANVDLVLIVTSVNTDFSINRLRRYALLAQHGQAQSVIVLSKTDLSGGKEWEVLEEIQNTFPEFQCVMTSCVDQTGVERIRGLVAEGRTAVFVGSSGVGKSTLVNMILSNKVQKTGGVREQDEKGRHTTSGSNLFFTSSGGIIIDTPGLREVQLLADEDDLESLIPDVHALSLQCKFADCTHAGEPGCAICEALAAGDISDSEVAAYLKMQRELNFGRRRLDQKLASEERKKWKKIAVQNRQRKNLRERQ